jgi:hypothetical protein
MGDGTQIAVVRPRNFRDGATIGEYFRQEIPVIINLEDMDNAEAERIIDFASGLILGLCGDIERLSRRTFLIVPAGATILTTHKALTEEGFFNQALPPSGQYAQCQEFKGTGVLRFLTLSARHGRPAGPGPGAAQTPPRPVRPRIPDPRSP